MASQAWRERNRERLNSASLAWYYANKDKARARAKKYRASHPSKNRSPGRLLSYRKQRLKAYGLTIEAYESMRQAQGNACAVCRVVPPVAGRRRLAVDHDHSTGAVRALLCPRCNVAIGLLDDDADRAFEIALYLERHRG